MAVHRYVVSFQEQWEEKLLQVSRDSEGKEEGVGSGLVWDWGRLRSVGRPASIPLFTSVHVALRWSMGERHLSSSSWEESHFLRNTLANNTGTCTILGVQSWVRFCWQEFGEFPRLLGRYCSYILPKQAGGTPQILVNKTSPMTGRLRVYNIC